MPTPMLLLRTAALYAMNHSGELNPMMATEQRASNPNLIKAAEAVSTSVKTLALLTLPEIVQDE